jgi:thiamine-phosphate pyrophosphorylase
MSRPAFDPALCLVIGPDDTRGRDVCDVVAHALEGGVTMLQLRWKHVASEPLVTLARRLVVLTARHGVPLILNDRVELVAAAGAQGAHVGQSDLEVARARALLGPDALLGLSIEHTAQLAGLDATQIDYVGVGPIFATATKPDHAAPLGIAGLAALRGRTGVPLLAIGGVSVQHASALRRAGADGLAVVSAIAGAPAPADAARALRRAFDA